MAVLNAADRAAVRALWAKLNAELCGITKADLLAAVNAADDWVDSNAASFNAALPQPAKAALSAKQKAHILMFVVGRRWEVS